MPDEIGPEKIGPREIGPAEICSAKDCRQPAAYDLQWNNPKIHTPERRKHWLACPDHRDSLSAFLSARGFLRDVMAYEPPTP